MNLHQYEVTIYSILSSKGSHTLNFLRNSLFTSQLDGKVTAYNCHARPLLQCLALQRDIDHLEAIFNCVLHIGCLLTGEISILISGLNSLVPANRKSKGLLSHSAKLFCFSTGTRHSAQKSITSFSILLWTLQHLRQVSPSITGHIVVNSQRTSLFNIFVNTSFRT